MIFSKIYSRDIPLVMVEAWNKSFELISNMFNLSFPKTVFIYSKGLVHIYRQNQAFNKEFAEEISKKISPRDIEREIDTYQKLDSEKKSYYHFDELIRLTDKIKKGFPISFLSSWCVHWHKSGIQKFDHKLINKLEDIREKDRIFDECLDGINENLKKASIDMGIDFRLSRFLLLDEIKNKKIPDSIKNREKSYIFIDGELSLDVNAAIKREGIVLESIEKENKTEIRGFCANQGKVKGEVRVILKKEEFSKVNQGCILVAHMTTPSYIPIMDKAAAFVTDEGGIVCHAAIMSREMQKPCIVGTKISTQFLKDGDYVEVDATNGIIRIIEKKSPE